MSEQLSFLILGMKTEELTTFNLYKLSIAQDFKTSLE